MSDGRQLLWLCYITTATKLRLCFNRKVKWGIKLQKPANYHKLSRGVCKRKALLLFLRVLLYHCLRKLKLPLTALHQKKTQGYVLSCLCAISCCFMQCGALSKENCLCRTGVQFSLHHVYDHKALQQVTCDCWYWYIFAHCIFADGSHAANQVFSYSCPWHVAWVRDLTDNFSVS